MYQTRHYRDRRQYGRRIVIISQDGTRSLTLRPFVVALGALFLGLLSVAYLGATAYLVFRDDLLTLAFARNAAQQQAYEDRIAALRGEIDRIASRQIIQTIGIDDKVDQLLAAGRALDERTRLIGSLVAKARAQGLLPAPETDLGEADPLITGSLAPQAYAEKDRSGQEDAFAPLLTRSFSQDAESRPLTRADIISPEGDGTIDATKVAGAFARVDRIHLDAARMVAAAAKTRVATVSGLIENLGVTPSLAIQDEDASSASDSDALGGPYIPFSSTESLASALRETETALDQLGALRKTLRTLPLAAPLPGAVRTSNFGSRRDPFLGAAAFHAGLDFRAPVGRKVAATASGTVVVAGYHGGYGNLVEVDHGNGLSTRYAHLSKILVRHGQRLEAGAFVGEVGSTGRSTGPHLHYETRREGIAVNPEIYLAAGSRIVPLLP